MKAKILVGVSASGKSTYAKELMKKEKSKWVEINRDALRFSLMGASSWGDYKFTKAGENLITQVQEDMARAAYGANRNVIFSDTNLNEGRLNNLISFLKSLGYTVEIKEFIVSLEEAWKRDALRENGVGASVIYNQYKNTIKKKYLPDESLPKTVVFDIDGSLSLMDKAVRSPFEWSKVYQDEVRTEIRDMLWGYQNQGYTVVLASGRDEQCRELTELWMQEEAGVMFSDLFMRPEGNCEKDTIIKERMLFDQIGPKYNVVAWVDDRPVVSRHLRLLGVNVIQVADPHIEF